MKISPKTTIQNSALLASALTLVACGTLSQVNEQGQTSDPVWPEVKNIVFKDGSYPNLDNLSAIGPGMTKSQLYGLIGRPHFKEGLFGVREWDYWFHFRAPEGVLSCQYKVLFDESMLAQNFLWREAACGDAVEGLLAQPQAQALMAQMPQESIVVNTLVPAQKISLNADVLFAFGSAKLTANGQQEVAQVAAVIQAAAPAPVHITGYTDRIGAPAYNQRLSLERAQTVVNALRAQGVAPERMHASGAGSADPLVECAAQPKQALIACLSPNRRVDIVVKAH